MTWDSEPDFGPFGDAAPPPAAAAAPPPQPAPPPRQQEAIPRSTAPYVPPAPAAPPKRRNPRTSAGLAMIVCACGVGAGALAGGLPGAGAGLLAVGSLRNLNRARRGLSGDTTIASGDAAKSLSLGLLGVAAAVYLGYHAYKAKQD